MIAESYLNVQSGQPPVRVAQKALAKLSLLMSKSGLPCEIRTVESRRHELYLCKPEASGEALVFVRVRGFINARTGVIAFATQRVFTATQHVLERLHQRLGEMSSVAVLREVYSCLGVGVVMDEAARSVGARHWPIATTNGLFVCVPEEGGGASVLVTWIRRDQLGKKWGRIEDDLRAASAESGRLLEDSEFSAELLRLHSWLLRPHAPGPDLQKTWWSSRAMAEQRDAVREFEKALADNDVETESPVADQPEETDAGGVAQPAGDLAEVDSAGQVHGVKVYDRYTGIVMRVSSTGPAIVGLRNGFFGVLRGGRSEVSGSPEGCAAPLQLGARISVEVLRVIGKRYTGPHSILLQRPDRADVEWSQVRERHPVGAVVTGSVTWRGSGGSLIDVVGGASGWLRDAELSWSGSDGLRRDTLTVGQTIRAQVVGHDDRRRKLKLSVRKFEGHPFERVDESIVLGSAYKGVVTKVVDYGAFVLLPLGVSALLHRTEIPAEVRPERGDELVVEVIAIDKERRRVSLKFLERT